VSGNGKNPRDKGRPLGGILNYDGKESHLPTFSTPRCHLLFYYFIICYLLSIIYYLLSTAHCLLSTCPIPLGPSHAALASLALVIYHISITSASASASTKPNRSTGHWDERVSLCPRVHQLDLHYQALRHERKRTEIAQYPSQSTYLFSKIPLTLPISTDRAKETGRERERDIYIYTHI
jgi:hypothetical protein